MPRGVRGYRVRIDYLPGKRGAYEYEVYVMGPRMSGVVSSHKTRKQAQAHIKKYINPEIRRRAGAEKEAKKKTTKRRKK